MSELYAVIGQNTRNAIVQSKRLAPFHEDITRTQPFEPESVSPGQYTKIKLDFKHATDRELVLNDIRFRFTLDFSDAGATTTTANHVFCCRGTDLIRELTVKINEDIVFKADRFQELTMLWLMNNHKLAGEEEEARESYLMNYGVIPAGMSPPFYLDTTTNKKYFYNSAKTLETLDVDAYTKPGLEFHDGLPRLIWYRQSGVSDYKFTFDISLNQLCGPIFHRMHMRRIEFVQLEVMFEPWVSHEQTTKFLLFRQDPTAVANFPAHPYAKAKFTNLQIRQYRTTVMDGCVKAFTLPPTRMLSWLMHRYSRREYQFNFGTDTQLDIQLHDWEIRSNIVRVWWMLAPKNNVTTPSTENGFTPFAAPCEGYENLFGVEVRWKNDKVLDLDTVYQVYRHYVLSDNKRYSLSDPHLRCARLMSPPTDGGQEISSEKMYYTWNEDVRNATALGREHYEMPIYHVDLCMNITHGVGGTELVGGIVNDTADYVIRLKKVYADEGKTKTIPFVHTGTRTLYVWIEYQTLVNLAANSNQFNRGSQIITKQLNVQN